MKPSAIVASWPPVIWRAGDALSLDFVESQVMDQFEGTATTCGEAFWSGSAGQGAAGFVWDWVELMPNVLVLANPMSIVTNLQVVDDDGKPVSPGAALREVNAIVHRLAWQEAVGRSLGSRKVPV